MLSGDLARLYQVQAKVLVQAVKRNIKRFPDDVCFQLTTGEYQNLRSQIVTSSWGGHRWPPLAFSEQGVAMLSSVLHSRRAIEANISIMRAFVRAREVGAQNRELLLKLDAIEKRVDHHDADIRYLIDAIRGSAGIDVSADEEPRKQIGFRARNE